MDGAYKDRSEQNLKPKFIKAKSPTEAELHQVIKIIAVKSIKSLRKFGYLDASVPEETLGTGLDPLFEEHPEHARAMAASIKQRIAFGERSGQKVRTIKHLIHRAFGYEEDVPVTTKPNCVAVNGFTLHADTLIKKHRREALEQMIRYTARGPFSHKRLTQEVDADLRYTLKTPWNDGTIAIKLSPEELLEKLVALVPIPRFNLTRYAGIFAPCHKLRDLIVLTPKLKPKSPSDDELPKQLKFKWHQLLKRVFGIDINNCPWCHAKSMRFVAVIQSHDVIERFLSHIDYPARPPPVTPSKLGQQEFEF